jgi:trans-aconitate 2-methyltransferase
MRWDPQQYGRYSDERSRPFHDLVDRIGATSPRRVVDLGCGPGLLTAVLADRWPDAQVNGVDSSPEMVARATALDQPRLSFKLGDIAAWEPTGEDDVVVTNAALQWVPGHRALIEKWTTAMPPDSWLAWQVPGNFGSPSHTLMRELAESPAWAGKLAGVLRHDDAVHSPAEYASLLLTAGWSVDAWETTYLHVLSGTDPVLQWVRGTGLRPVLAALDAQDPTGRDRLEFEAEYGQLLRGAYPATEHGTIFEFRRIFAVGHKK